MKATLTNGTKVNITFPSKGDGMRNGYVKVNGEQTGTWCQNCEGDWHANFIFNGRKRDAWGTDKRDMVTSAMECVILNRPFVF